MTIENVNLKTHPITISLRSEFIKAFPPFLIFLGTVIILLSFVKDIVRVGFHATWLLIRIGYLPFILTVWYIFKDKLLTVRYYEAPLWLAGLYISLLCTYFSFSTGGLTSDYIFGLIQFYIAIAVMPITALTFYVLSLISLLIYVGLNLFYMQPGALHNYTIISTLIPLLLFSSLVYYISSRVRRTKINLHNTLSKTLIEMDTTIQIQSKKLAEIETKAALGLLAVQMAHDIRSPLSALNVIANELSQIPEDLRILTRSAITRINDIANNLLKKYKCPSGQELNDYLPELVSDALESVISEKRVKIYGNKIDIDYTIDISAQGVFASLQLIEFKRMISNLIDNAIEAIIEQGQIDIKITANEKVIMITIRDNGCGISIKDTKSLLNEGSSSKDDGNGLGLFHAKRTMDALHGDISINSLADVGTNVSLDIPRSICPIWFASKINLYHNSVVVIIDDDPSIGNVWLSRFESLVRLHNIRLVKLHSLEELMQWKKENIYQNTVYLCDYEFIGQTLTGLDIIKKLDIIDFSFLVTSRYEDLEIRRVCEDIKLKIIPKNFSVYIPISVLSSESAQTMNKNLHAVLIDDDPMVHSTWEFSAIKYNKNIYIFNSTEKFFLKYDYIHDETPIYIDSNLGSGIKGEIVSEQIYLKGFKNIYLITGEDAGQFEKAYWLKDILSKDPPWK